MNPIVSIKELSKIYGNDFKALKNVNLDIMQGEILALLGPNGAGKTTLISTITGIITASSGSIEVAGFDIGKQFRETRKLIGLVPQELTLAPFDTVWNTVRFSRGLFGKKSDFRYLEQVLENLSLKDKKDTQLRMLSGGMKRRVLIAKALAHEPRILFLDEPTAGVDVELRKDMWKLVEKLREDGVTIILTTHYIEEAEEIADRIGIINGGELLLIEDKATLMQKLGKKELIIELKESIQFIPDVLKNKKLMLNASGTALVYSYDTAADATGITSLLNSISQAGLTLKDISTKQSSLEDIFVDLVRSDNSGDSA